MKKCSKTQISFFLNALAALGAMLGVFLACYFARRDGYTHWGKKLLYFTQLSNIWIGVVCLVCAVYALAARNKKKEPYPPCLSALKFVFTVSITVTAIVFCTFLAPFADFNVWTFSSVLTHVVVPALSIADFFVNERIRPLKKHVYYSLLPPLFYFIFASVLCLNNVDFGRGDPYPYFFMNFRSPVGLFGFDGSGDLPQFGAVYWIILILLLILGLSRLYFRLHPKTRK